VFELRKYPDGNLRLSGFVVPTRKFRLDAYCDWCGADGLVVCLIDERNCAMDVSNGVDGKVEDYPNIDFAGRGCICISLRAKIARLNYRSRAGYDVSIQVRVVAKACTYSSSTSTCSWYALSFNDFSSSGMWTWWFHDDSECPLALQVRDFCTSFIA